MSRSGCSQLSWCHIQRQPATSLGVVVSLKHRLPTWALAQMGFQATSCQASATSRKRTPAPVHAIPPAHNVPRRGHPPTGSSMTENLPTPPESNSLIYQTEDKKPHQSPVIKDYSITAQGLTGKQPTRLSSHHHDSIQLAWIGEKDCWLAFSPYLAPPQSVPPRGGGTIRASQSPTALAVNRRFHRRKVGAGGRNRQLVSTTYKFKPGSRTAQPIQQTRPAPPIKTRPNPALQSTVSSLQPNSPPFCNTPLSTDPDLRVHPKP